ncbi:hydrogenase maturation nickel metallochaperone HypA [Dongshaea marina]|uniref:hydrogenase maturation nickel metallochaperone HypA n=1 Tax=Dongshaea marina TaxID=2047966 RepID=UPI000D3E78CC|nr:hydrogenase maturation nickel metallochaperone HypA [Dongshaea marina]
MHELSIAENIIKSVEQIARQKKLDKIRSVTVEVGPLSGVVEESLEFCFPHAVAASFLDGMELKIESIPFEVSCRHCHRHSSPELLMFLCQHCGSSDVEEVAGRELRIKSIEV